MVLSAAGSPLVAGSLLEVTMKTAQVRVKRAFFYNGEPTKVGAVLEVPAVFAAELIAAKKAERVSDEPAKTDKPQEPAAKAKGGKDAG